MYKIPQSFVNLCKIGKFLGSVFILRNAKNIYKLEILFLKNKTREKIVEFKQFFKENNLYSKLDVKMLDSASVK